MSALNSACIPWMEVRTCAAAQAHDQQMYNDVCCVLAQDELCRCKARHSSLACASDALHINKVSVQGHSRLAYVTCVPMHSLPLTSVAVVYNNVKCVASGTLNSTVGRRTAPDCASGSLRCESTNSLRFLLPLRDNRYDACCTHSHDSIRLRVSDCTSRHNKK